VTKGTRIAVIAWIHSLVRDPAEREVLYDLHVASQRILEHNGKTREYDLVSKTLVNLTRRWAEM
jgi:PKHD-type hydroxylase